MALVNPPDGWEMAVGTWGTDADESTTVLRSANRSINLKNTALATIRVRQTVDAAVPVEGDRSYKAWAVAQADSNAAGRTIVSGINWHDKDLGFISSSDIFNGVVGTINTWERKDKIVVAPSTARFARARFERVTTGAGFNAYLDEMGIIEAAPVAVASVTNQSIPTGSQTDVVWATPTELVEISYNGGTGVFTVGDVAGLFAVQIRGTFADVATGKQVSTFISTTGSSPTGSALLDARDSAPGGATALSPVFGFIMRRFVAGDTFKLTVGHDHGSNRNFGGSLSVYLVGGT